MWDDVKYTYESYYWKNPKPTPLKWKVRSDPGPWQKSIPLEGGTEVGGPTAVLTHVSMS